MASQPVGMLPSISGIEDLDAYKNNETIQQFQHAEEVISSQISGCFEFFHTTIG